MHPIGDPEFTLAASMPTLDVPAGSLAPADAIEFRLDHSDAPLEELASYAERWPLIATNRPRWEGGEADDVGRLETLIAAAEHDRVAAIDIEHRTVAAGEADELRAVARANDAIVIVSQHDFAATPAVDRMTADLDRAAAWGDVAKLAVTARRPPDVLALLQATHRASADGHAVATMSMGAQGRHSRVIAPLYGSRIGYAPVTEERATAPGQYPLATMADLLAALR